MRTAHEVAAEVGMSARWLQAQAKAGKIAHHRLGRRVLFTEDDIAAIITGSAVTPRESETTKGRRRREYPSYARPVI